MNWPNNIIQLKIIELFFDWKNLESEVIFDDHKKRKFAQLILKKSMKMIKGKTKSQW